jgi:hypothetical protein
LLLHAKDSGNTPLQGSPRSTSEATRSYGGYQASGIALQPSAAVKEEWEDDNCDRPNEQRELFTPIPPLLRLDQMEELMPAADEDGELPLTPGNAVANIESEDVPRDALFTALPAGTAAGSSNGRQEGEARLAQLACGNVRLRREAGADEAVDPAGGARIYVGVPGLRRLPGLADVAEGPQLDLDPPPPGDALEFLSYLSRPGSAAACGIE